MALNELPMKNRDDIVNRADYYADSFPDGWTGDALDIMNKPDLSNMIKLTLVLSEGWLPIPVLQKFTQQSSEREWELVGLAFTRYWMIGARAADEAGKRLGQHLKSFAWSDSETLAHEAYEQLSTQESYNTLIDEITALLEAWCNDSL